MVIQVSLEKTCFCKEIDKPVHDVLSFLQKAASAASETKRLFTFGRECLIDRRGRDVVEVIADGLESNTEQQLHDLLLPVASGDEVLNGFILGIATLANEFLHQGHESGELFIWYWNFVADGSYNLSRRIQCPFRDRGVRCCAVVAVVLYTRCKQN